MRNGDANVVKIGRAHDVDVRRGQFETGNPETLTVIDVIETDDARDLETILHRILISKRLRGEFFGLTLAEAEEAGRQAREYLSDDLPLAREAEQLAQAECDSPPRPATEEERKLHREVLEAREAKHLATLRSDHADNAFKVAIGTSEGLEGLASWRSHLVSRFDEAAFKAAHPELQAAFSQKVPQRTLRLVWS